MRIIKLTELLKIIYNALTLEKVAVVVSKLCESSFGKFFKSQDFCKRFLLRTVAGSEKQKVYIIYMCALVWDCNFANVFALEKVKKYYMETRACK